MMNRFRFHTTAGLRLCMAAAVCVLASCQKEKAEAPAKAGTEDSTSTPEDRSPVLAEVSGVAITQEDLEAEVNFRIAQRRPVPEKSELLDELIERQALIHRAREAGLESDRAVRRELENLLISQLRERELESRLRSVEATEEELRAAYDAKLAEFTRPAKVRIAILQLKAGKSASEAKRSAVRSRIEEAREKIVAAPAPGGRGPAAQGFGAIAINYSEDQASRYRGGDIGWLNEGSFDHPWPKPLLEAAYSAEKGEVSEVLEVEGDFYLVMKTDYREAAVQSFSDAKAVLRIELLRAKRERLLEDFRRETLRGVETSIDEAALAAVKLPEGGRPARSTPGETQPPALPGRADK